MAEDWKTVPVTDVHVGDRVRHASGAEILVARIEPTFMGRDNMMAFIEDSPDRWFKAPVPKDGTIEVLVGA
jgi:hypothetical protein